MTSLRRHLRAQVYSNLKTEQEIKTNSSSVYENISPCVLVPPPSGYRALNRPIGRKQIAVVMFYNGKEKDRKEKEGRKGEGGRMEGREKEKKNRDERI